MIRNLATKILRAPDPEHTVLGVGGRFRLVLHPRIQAWRTEKCSHSESQVTQVVLHSPKRCPLCSAHKNHQMLDGWTFQPNLSTKQLFCQDGESMLSKVGPDMLELSKAQSGWQFSVNAKYEWGLRPELFFAASKQRRKPRPGQPVGQRQAVTVRDFGQQCRLKHVVMTSRGWAF